MGTVQIKGRIPEDVAALFDLAVDIKAQTTHVERRHRGGVTRTVAFTQNAAVIAALTDWTDAVIDANPDLAQQFHTALRDAKDRWSMLDVGEAMLEEVGYLAGTERAAAIREHMNQLLPLAHEEALAA